MALRPQHGSVRLQRLHHGVDTDGARTREEERRIPPRVREQITPRFRSQSLAGKLRRLILYYVAATSGAGRSFQHKVTTKCTSARSTRGGEHTEIK